MTREQVKKLHAAFVRYVKNTNDADEQELLSVMLEVLTEPENKPDMGKFVVSEQCLRDIAAGQRLRGESPRIPDPLT